MKNHPISLFQLRAFPRRGRLAGSWSSPLSATGEERGQMDAHAPRPLSLPSVLLSLARALRTLRRAPGSSGGGRAEWTAVGDPCWNRRVGASAGTVA